MATSAATWMTALSACLEAAEREHAGSPSPVVDHEVQPVAAGEPDEFRVWLVCRTRADERQFRDGDLGRFVSGLKRRMLAAGFAESALAALEIRLTSREETAGARFTSFR